MTYEQYGFVKVSRSVLCSFLLLVIMTTPLPVGADAVSINFEAANGPTLNVLTSTLEVIHETDEIDQAQTRFTGGFLGELDVDFSGLVPVVNDSTLTGEFVADWDRLYLEVYLGTRLGSPFTVFAHLPSYRIPIGLPATPPLELVKTVTTAINPSPPTERADPVFVPHTTLHVGYDIDLISATHAAETYLVTMSLTSGGFGFPVEEIECSACGPVPPLAYQWSFDLPDQIIATGQFTRVVPEPGVAVILMLSAVALCNRRHT